uniref:(California timema) hypothetical protein n=1 Tax=Timema californicum TaxID=61474 RepID=A0A7R9P490_TIMCA|nr:unnamed protein product [Timema californicum]
MMSSKHYLLTAVALVVRYSSPMASLVLTDSLQLTALKSYETKLCELIPRSFSASQENTTWTWHNVTNLLAINGCNLVNMLLKFCY